MITTTKTSQIVEIEADSLTIRRNTDRYDSSKCFTLSFGEGDNTVNIILKEKFFKLLQEEIKKIK